MIELSDVTYMSSPGEVKIDSLRVEKGETAVVLGPKLAGKSDLLRVCIGVKKPEKGTVRTFGGDVVAGGSSFLTKKFLDIGFVTQQQTLLDNLTISGNIGLPLDYHVGPVARDLHFAVMELLKKFGIEDCADKFPNEVMFHNAKLALFARAVVLGPRLLFMDEPTSGDLDPVGFMKIFDAISTFKKEGTTMLITTCSPSLAAMEDATLYYLLDGRLFTHKQALDSANPKVEEYLKQMRTYAKRQMEETTGFFKSTDIENLLSEE